mmetsp:Transcript_62010/g.93626  ORF Transcript_62010/g.93626 Transcript_62010/m.93626 type:complete len:362 (+) Transcript_62010:95-1180(+)
MMRSRNKADTPTGGDVEDGDASASFNKSKKATKLPQGQLWKATGLVILLAFLYWMNRPSESEIVDLRNDYIDLVIMGLLGGLNHGAIVDKYWQSSSAASQAGNCLTRTYETNKPTNLCVVKWDGYERLSLVREVYKKIHSKGVEGDLVECGVWRGGQTILMKALVKAYGDTSRKVWVSDSFGGVPNAEQQKAHPDFANVPEDAKKKDEKYWGGKVQQKDASGETVNANILTVQRQSVEDNFRRFGLYDEEIKWLPGWFNEALPHAAEQGLQKIAILRIDGDLYSSTMDVLVSLYPYVSSGGYVIFDDYNIGPSKQAIHDYFDKHGIDKTKIVSQRVTGKRIDADANPDKALDSPNAYFRKP